MAESRDESETRRNTEKRISRATFRIGYRQTLARGQTEDDDDFESPTRRTTEKRISRAAFKTGHRQTLIRGQTEVDDDFEFPTIELFEKPRDHARESYIPVDDLLEGTVNEYSNFGEIVEGDTFEVQFHLAKNCERFVVDLITDFMGENKALHLNARFRQRYIVRNCQIKKFWGEEERVSSSPFRLIGDMDVIIEIFISPTEYLISINGHHFAAFRHRISYDLIQKVVVKGDVSKVQCRKINKSIYPTRLPDTIPKIITRPNCTEFQKYHPPLRYTNFAELRIQQAKFDEDSNNPGLELPYYGKLERELEDGDIIRFLGRIKLLPHSFLINFQLGNNIFPHPIIVFHINTRFGDLHGDHMICTNYWEYDWGSEERTPIDGDLMPGRSFDLSIHCSEDSFEVYVDNNFVVDFKYRINRILCDTIYVQGDIKLWQVELCKVQNSVSNDEINSIADNSENSSVNLFESISKRSNNASKLLQYSGEMGSHSIIKSKTSNETRSKLDFQGDSNKVSNIEFMAKLGVKKPVTPRYRTRRLRNSDMQHRHSGNFNRRRSV